MLIKANLYLFNKTFSSVCIMSSLLLYSATINDCWFFFVLFANWILLGRKFLFYSGFLLYFYTISFFFYSVVFSYKQKTFYQMFNVDSFLYSFLCIAKILESLFTEGKNLRLNGVVERISSGVIRNKIFSTIFFSISSPNRV